MESFRVTRVRPIPGLGIGRYSEPLDVMVTNGTITTIEPTRGVGDGDLDTDGANLMPGLWDGHTHFSLAAPISQCTRFSHKVTKSEIPTTVEDHLRHRPPRLAGYGFRSVAWPIPPTAADLDAITTVLVALMPCDLHSLWCNAPALKQTGAAGYPTGFPVEEKVSAGIRRIMSRYLDLVEHAVQAVELETAPRELVGIADFSPGRVVKARQQRTASRSIELRVEATTYLERLDGLTAMGAGTGDKLAENLRVGPLKIAADGSVDSRTAHCIASYPNPLPGYPNDKPNHTRSELFALLGRAREARF